MENPKHLSTMTSFQRKTLIDILKKTYSLKNLVYFTDPELHELWLVECEYPNPYKDGK